MILHSIAFGLLAAPTVLQTPAPQPLPPAAKPAAQAPTPAPPTDPETQAFDAALALKKAAKNEESAKAFEEIAKKYPQSPRLSEALVEAGLGWYRAARKQTVLHRATEASKESFAKATKAFTEFLRDRPADPLAAQAQYMIGMNRCFQGDLAGAEAAFDSVMTKYPKDAKYFPLALERRSAMRRHLLESDLALADLQRYVATYPKAGSDDKVPKYLQFTQMFEKPAIPLKVETWVQGDPQTLEGLRGKVVGLLFFATWCPHCEEERPFVLDLVDRYSAAGFKMIGVVNHNQKQTVESVKAWLPKNGVGFPVLMDANQATGESYHMSSIPDLVLIDKAGKVRWHDNPGTLWDYTIETLLAEDAPPPPTAPAPAKPK